MEDTRECDYCYTQDTNRNFYPCTKPEHLIPIKPLNGYSICEACLKEQYDDSEEEEKKGYISESKSLCGTLPNCT